MKVYRVRKFYRWFHQSIPHVVFSVGYKNGTIWITHSEYDNKEEAQAMCHYLNRKGQNDN